MPEPYTKYEPRLHVVLHQPEIPYNTGSVGRTCVAVGAKLWLVRPLGFRVDDYYLRRAGLDYWEHLEWQVVDNWDELQSALPAQPGKTGAGRRWLFTKKAERSYLDAQFQPADVLVFGSESSGLPDALLDAHPTDSQLRIPTRAEVRSLNLSNAVAVASYEALRQWHGSS
jgi:tRNA (cytidine/uridine-2'-O-)-methyltransferase